MIESIYNSLSDDCKILELKLFDGLLEEKKIIYRYAKLEESKNLN